MTSSSYLISVPYKDPPTKIINHDYSKEDQIASKLALLGARTSCY